MFCVSVCVWGGGQGVQRLQYAMDQVKLIVCCSHDSLSDERKVTSSHLGKHAVHGWLSQVSTCPGRATILQTSMEWGEIYSGRCSAT